MFYTFQVVAYATWRHRALPFSIVFFNFPSVTSPSPFTFHAGHIPAVHIEGGPPLPWPQSVRDFRTGLMNDTSSQLLRKSVYRLIGEQIAHAWSFANFSVFNNKTFKISFWVLFLVAVCHRENCCQFLKKKKQNKVITGALCASIYSLLNFVTGIDEVALRPRESSALNSEESVTKSSSPWLAYFISVWRCVYTPREPKCDNLQVFIRILWDF